MSVVVGLVEDLKGEMVRSPEELVRGAGAVFPEGYRPGASISINSIKERRYARTDCSQLANIRVWDDALELDRARGELERDVRVWLDGGVHFGKFLGSE